MRAINGLMPHAYSGELSGSVRIDGRPTTELRLREIGQVVGTLLQDPAKQIIGATVEAELAFGPENLGVTRGGDPERIREVIADDGHPAPLRTRDGAPVGRRAPAAGHGRGPDAPTAGCTSSTSRSPTSTRPPRDTCSACSERLADAGHAVVIVEHRVEEALQLRPDRVLAMDEGVRRTSDRSTGSSRSADPDAVKLPFEVVLARDRGTRISCTRRRTAPTAARELVPGPSRLAFEAVEVRLGERDVLRGVERRPRGAGGVAVLGPNGSGKTTLFRTAMGLVDARCGHGPRRRGGHARADRSPTSRRSIGYVFQSPSQMLFARTVARGAPFRAAKPGDADPSIPTHFAPRPSVARASPMWRTSSIARP